MDSSPGSPNRRALLRRLAASGALGAAGLAGWLSRALAKGDIPTVPGVNRLKGSVTVNGKPAAVGTPVSPRDKVATGRASEAVLVVGDDAFLLRENTVIEFGESQGFVSRMLVQTGRVLSVFGRRATVIKAATATIGIRGTGAYLEIHPDHVYFCLCYGEAELDGPGMSATKRIVTQHHDMPLVISEAGGVMAATPGPVMNHTDDELILLESLVGREPPFGTQPVGRY